MGIYKGQLDSQLILTLTACKIRISQAALCQAVKNFVYDHSVLQHSTVKYFKIQTPKTFALITVKFEQGRIAID